MSSAAALPPAAASAGSLPDRAVSPAGRIVRNVSAGLLLVATMLLVAVLVAGANGIRVRIEQTGSMAPALRPGDLVAMQQVPARSVRLGDVIGVRGAGGAVIVHRVRRIDGAAGGLSITTRGDANPTSETWTVPAGAEVALVRGRVPSLGAAVDAVKGPGAALAVMLAGLVLAFFQLRAIWRRPA